MLPFLLIVALINSCIELEISAPSFPAILSHFSVSEAVVGLTITYNLFAFCLASLVYGPLSDQYGRRRIMLIGNGILVIGAVGCVIAPSMPWLLVARFIQGLGAATSAVVVSAIIADVYPVDRAARLYALMNAVFTSLMALSPVLGGLITTTFGWRGNYAFVALICLIAWLLLAFFLPETRKEASPTPLSLQNYTTLLKSYAFLRDATIPSLLYGCYMVFVAIAPFLYMQTFKLNLLTYTLHQGVIVALFAIASVCSSTLIKRVSPAPLIRIASSTALISSIIMGFANTPLALTICMSTFCLGFALLYPLVFARSLEIFPALKGTASSLIMSLRYLLCTLMTGIASTLYNGKVIILLLIFVCANFIIWTALRGQKV